MSGGDALPVTIISGYLGAGKTTLVNHILRNPNGERITVLVNDFGDIAVDEHLIISDDGDVIALANGCVCCSIGGDLTYALIDVLNQSHGPDRIVIEASGVAEPQRIAAIARAEPDLELDATVTLVDAGGIRALADDTLVGSTVRNQLAAADLVIVNKIDLTSPAGSVAIHDWIEREYPATTVLEAVHGAIDTSVILGIDNDDKVTTHNTLSTTPHHPLESHEPLYVRWQGVSANRSDRDTLAFALECLPAELLRLKGLVRNTPTDDIHVVHAVGRRCEIVTRAPRAGDPQGRLLSAIMRSDGRDGQTLKIILDELFETSSNQ